MVFIWMHTAITTPYKQANNITGTSGYGVGLDASSSKNTTYNQSLTISQEQTMVLLWLHTASYNKKEKNTKIFQKKIIN